MPSFKSSSGSDSTTGRYGFASGRTNTSTKSTTKKGSVSSVCSPTGYKNCCNTFANKIQSYKMLMNQTTGAARCGRPTPATLNTFANWINKGAIVQTVSTAQVSRWAKNANKNFNTKMPTPASCRNVLSAKFGKTVIKAVARTKSGSFMVACAPTCKGKKFCMPK